MNLVWTCRRPDRFEYATIFFLLLVAILVITPRFWEPGNESWNEWGAARLILDCWGMPRWDLPIGYALYVLPFLLLDYGPFLVAEHIATHMIAYFAIYSLLRGWLAPIPASLMLLSFLPMLSWVEGSNTVFATGLFAIYLHRLHPGRNNSDLIPVSLGFAALSNGAYLIFFAGHFIGALVEKAAEKEKLFSIPHSIPSLLGKTLVVLIPVVAIAFKADRLDNNHYLITNQNFFPAPISSSFSSAFFQIGIWQHQIHHWTPERFATTSYQRANDEIFKGAQSVSEAVLSAPDVVFDNVKRNVLFAPLKLGELVTGRQVPSGAVGDLALTIILFLVSALGISIAVLRLVLERKFALGFSILIGSAGTIAVLLLTWIINYRYNVTLQPLLAAGLLFAFLSIRRDDAKPLLLLLVLTAVSLYALFAASLLPQSSWIVEQIESDPKFAVIPVSLPTMLGVAGLVFTVAAWLFNRMRERAGLLLSPLYERITISARALLILFIVVLSWQSIQEHFKSYPEQIAAIAAGEGFIESPTGMRAASAELLKTFDEGSVILSYQGNWLKSIEGVRYDQIRSYSDLPPEKVDPSVIFDFLSNVTHIWVPNSMLTDNPSAINANTRMFKIHIEPYLDDLLRTQGWQVRPISRWGYAYELGS